MSYYGNYLFSYLVKSVLDTIVISINSRRFISLYFLSCNFPPVTLNYTVTEANIDKIKNVHAKCFMNKNYNSHPTPHWPISLRFEPHVVKFLWYFNLSLPVNNFFILFFLASSLAIFYRSLRQHSSSSFGSVNSSIRVVLDLENSFIFY